MKNKLGLALLLTSMTACAGSLKMADSIQVFKSSGDKQCMHIGKTLDETRQQLIDQGVTTNSGFCANRTDLMYPQVCGGGTPHIHVFSIEAQQLELAVKAGFQPVDKVPYEKAECRTKKKVKDNSI